MDRSSQRIEGLDISLFEKIQTQATDDDKRCLLAIQGATRRTYPSYSYLEIGSHLGGSIQPYLLDDQCSRIYSIDPRPPSQPDDRKPGFRAHYDGNSTERMLERLAEVDSEAMGKIECFDSDASEIDTALIVEKPRVAFVDGEHTNKAVRSDFRFCSEVLAPNGAIVFHDFWIVYRAIFQISRRLHQEGRPHLPLMLNRNVFSIFFDPAVVEDDPFLSALAKSHRKRLLFFRIRMAVASLHPRLLWRRLRRQRH